MTTTTIKDYTGLKFFDSRMNVMEVLEYSERYKGYLLSTNGEMNGMYQIEQAETIEFQLAKQYKYIESDRKYKAYEQEEQAKKNREEFEYNNTYGYAESIKITPMAKGKLLKILNTKENYAHDGEPIGRIARKDFIKSMLDKGYTLDHKKDLKYWAKDGELKTKANEYRLIETEGSFYVITKTEYDYGMYLKAR